MPQAVTHFLLSAIVVNLIRDFVIKNKRAFPLHLVLLGGIGGILPDFDIAVYWLIGKFGFAIGEIHRTYTHTIWVPLTFFVLSLVFWNWSSKFMSKRHLAWSEVFFVLGIGTFIHIILDSVVEGTTMPFYPLMVTKVGLNLAGNLPEHVHSSFSAVLDAALLIIWMVYIELKHKISNFI
jgi:membrane-bound metal-dependent hydrolase YbcI (DUF457 family)